MGGMSGDDGKAPKAGPRADIAEAARERNGASRLAPDVARRIERDGLRELIEAAEAEHGPITEEEIREKRDILRRAREARDSSGDAE
jgi:hypothetical protein